MTMDDKATQMARGMLDDWNAYVEETGHVAVPFTQFIANALRPLIEACEHTLNWMQNDWESEDKMAKAERLLRQALGKT